MNRMTHTKFEIQLVKTLRTGHMPKSLPLSNVYPYLFFNYPGGATEASENRDKFAKWLANRIAKHEVKVECYNSEIYISGDSDTYLWQLKDKNKPLPIKPKPESLYSCIRCKADVKSLNTDSLCHSCANKERNDEATERSVFKFLHRGY